MHLILSFVDYITKFWIYRWSSNFVVHNHCLNFRNWKISKDTFEATKVGLWRWNLTTLFDLGFMTSFESNWLMIQCGEPWLTVLSSEDPQLWNVFLLLIQWNMSFLAPRIPSRANCLQKHLLESLKSGVQMIDGILNAFAMYESQEDQQWKHFKK